MSKVKYKIKGVFFNNLALTLIESFRRDLFYFKMILFFKKLKNYFTYGIFEHPVKNELESVDELMNELDNLSDEEKNKLIREEDDKDKNKILWFIPLILFLSILRINQNQSIFDIISKYWFDFILLSACFSLFLLIWRRQTE